MVVTAKEDQEDDRDQKGDGSSIFWIFLKKIDCGAQRGQHTQRIQAFVHGLNAEINQTLIAAERDYPT